MPNILYYSKTALTGGAANALDYIDGDLLTDGDIAFVYVSGVLYVYKLNASSSAAESSPTVITPDTNPGTKRWELQQIYPVNAEHNADGTHKYAYPWLIDINVFSTPGAQTNWSIISTEVGAGSGFIYNAIKASNGNQNAAISWPVILAAGTWTFSLVHHKSTDRGIYTVALSVTGAVGTIDGYAGSPAEALTDITGIVVAATGKQTLSLTMATKHASSSNYTGAIQAVRLIRTA